MTKEEYLKNKIIDSGNSNKDTSEKKIAENKNNDNIDEHFLIKINHIKVNLSLNYIKKFLEKIVIPQYIDINKNEKSMILRFDSKKTSDFFLSKLKEKNYENINTLLEKPIKDCDNNIIPIYELSESERKNYLNIVKEKIENYKKNKEKIKNNKETIKNE